jgi:hypothetical protein
MEQSPQKLVTEEDWPIPERQISHVFPHMWNLNLKEYNMTCL